MSRLLAAFVALIFACNTCFSQTADKAEPADSTSAPTPSEESPAEEPANSRAGNGYAAVAPDELKIRLAPLPIEELEAQRDRILEDLRSVATELAALIIEQMRQEQAGDEEAQQPVNETLAEALTNKVDLVSRANIVLAAIEAKGGDVAADRAYLSAIEVLHPETPATSEAPTALTSEEQRASAILRQVDGLAAVVRAEPPVHERQSPWEVPVAELELELQPLTLEQIEERLEKWRETLQREVRKRIRYDILLNNPEKLDEAISSLPDDLTARTRSDAGEAISKEEIKKVLAEKSQAQQQIVRAIVERMNVAISLVKMRGGDAAKHIDYIASATGQKLNLYDPTVLYAQLRAWVFAPDGGILIALSILKFLAVLIAAWLLSILLGRVTQTGVNRIPRASSLLRSTLVRNVRRATMIVGLVVAITMLGVNAGPLLAMIGAAGLVVGLALQGTLSNFASGIMILVNRPYDVGDAINAGGVSGKVEAMNLVSTTILTFDNQVMVVPNNQIWNGVITNITGRSTRRVDLTFGIGYGDDIAKATSVLEETIKAHPKVLADPAPVIRVHELGDNSVNFVARPWANTSDYWDVYWDLHRDVKARFDKEGINIPFPQRDLHLPGPIEVKLANGPAQ